MPFILRLATASSMERHSTTASLPAICTSTTCMSGAHRVARLLERAARADEDVVQVLFERLLRAQRGDVRDGRLPG
jgi:hypothetical protein